MGNNRGSSYTAPADDIKLPPSTSMEELYGTMFNEGDKNNESLLITFVQGANLKCPTIEALVDCVIPGCEGLTLSHAS